MKETSVNGASLFYTETTVGCIQAANPSKKDMSVQAFWASGNVALRIGVNNVKLETAKQYVGEVIEKVRALDYSKVK